MKLPEFKTYWKQDFIDLHAAWYHFKFMTTDFNCTFAARNLIMFPQSICSSTLLEDYFIPSVSSNIQHVLASHFVEETEALGKMLPQTCYDCPHSSTSVTMDKMLHQSQTRPWPLAPISSHPLKDLRTIPYQHSPPFLYYHLYPLPCIILLSIQTLPLQFLEKHSLNPIPSPVTIAFPFSSQQKSLKELSISISNFYPLFSP